MPASPLRGRYLVQHRGWNLVLRVADALTPSSAQRPIPKSPSRLLVANGGQLGDAVLMSQTLTLLQDALPKTEIGVLVPSWTAAVFRHHRAVRRVHHADHWRVNRVASSGFTKWKRARSTAATAVREIRDIGYDVALDLYPYYPNMASVLAHADVPARIGYESGGRGGLYTDRLTFGPPLEHIFEKQLAVARRVAPDLRREDRVRLAHRIRQDLLAPDDEVERHLARLGLARPFIVCHMGTGDAIKRWPRAQWLSVISRLAGEGHRIVLTGQGQRDATEIDAVTASVGGVANLCDRLGWDEFTSVLSAAASVISVDTVAAQLADAFGTPLVGLWTGVALPHWKPQGKHSSTLMREVACAPCFQSHGCATMDCIRGISPDSVLAAVRTKLLVRV